MWLAKLVVISSLLFTIIKAQDHNLLPWQKISMLPWQIDYKNSDRNYKQIKSQHLDYLLTLNIEPSGIVQITDKRGLIRSRLELPGRPKKIWRDWGIPIDTLFDTIQFPLEIPIQQDIINLLIQIVDFRPNLEGLLWIVDDSEKFLTVVNPADSSMSYIMLPGGSNIDLIFHPDRLEVEGDIIDVIEKTKINWTINWLTLLPSLIKPNVRHHMNNMYGTTTMPFPKN